MGLEPDPHAATKTNATISDGKKTGTKHFWRKGPMLFARHGSILPSRCVKCNHFTTEPLKRQSFYWHPSAWNLLYLFTPIVYRLVAKIVRRQADVTFALCQPCRRKRLIVVSVGYLGILASLFMLMVTLNARDDKPTESLLCVLGFVISFVLMKVVCRRIIPVYIEDSIVRVKGCGKAFLLSLGEV